MHSYLDGGTLTDGTNPSRPTPTGANTAGQGEAERMESGGQRRAESEQGVTNARRTAGNPEPDDSPAIGSMGR